MEIDLDKILKIYAVESAEHLTAMEDAILGLEGDPLNDKLLEAIFRGAHTIKGNSASLGFTQLAGFAHEFEELLQHLRGRQVPVTHAAVTLLLRAVDGLRQMIPAAVAGRDELTPEQTELLADFVDGARWDQEREPVSAPLTNPDNVKPFEAQREELQAGLEKIGTVRVETDRLDRMLDLAGEIAIAHGRLSDALEPQRTSGEEAREAHLQVQRLTFQLQEEILKLRMVPLGPILRHYRRAVRDIARAHGKAARLELRGEEVEVDVSVVEHLKAPLLHMIRNAIGHGIESPEQRQALGKDPCGRLTFAACHEGGNIVIQIIDDGAGLDRRRIIERARRMEIVAEPEKLADTELFRLIFTLGFSTADKVTDLSGRGVGMDVVRQNIEALRGSVAIDSRPAAGTTITIRLPLTLAIIEGFGIGVGGETYILPLSDVVECVPLPAEASCRARQGQGVIDLRGQPLPYVRLRDWFKLPGRNPPREHIVVVEVDGTRAGLATDALYGPRQIVLKPLEKQLQGLPGIAGSAILGNGRVALVLNAGQLLRAVITSYKETPQLNGWAFFAQESLDPEATQYCSAG